MSGRYPALRSVGFRRLWLGLFVSNVGTWMQNVAQSWLVYRMTGDNPLYLGLLGFSFAIPMTLFPPIGGAVADRVHRVRLLYVTQTSALFLALVLAALASTSLLRPWHMLLATFVGATLLAFDNPTRQALVPDLVPREHLQNALSLNAATFTGAALIGPAVAGALLQRVGATWLFLSNAVSFLAVLGPLATLAVPAVPAEERGRATLREAFSAGLTYVRSDPTVRTLFVLSAIAALFARSYQQLLPIFATHVWNAGPTAYGALLSAAGAGALLGALALSSWRATKRHVWAIRASGLALAAEIGAFAAAPTLHVGVVALVAVGATATVFTTTIATKIQLDVPRALRGRVIGLYTITLIGLPALGSLGMAALARAFGARAAVTSGAGVLACAIVASTWMLRPGTETRAGAEP